MSRTLLLALACLPVATVGCGGSSSNPAPTATSTAGPATRHLLPALPGSYAALGASETFGVGANPRSNGYAYRVARLLHARKFVDLGVPGTTLHAGYDTELAGALSARPALCTVFFGVNDLRAGVSLASFLLDIRDMVVTLQSEGARVLIIGIPDLSYLPAVARLHISGLHRIVSSWNAGMAEVARRSGAHFLDLRRYDARLASHPRYVSSDGLHPSNSGHAALAHVIVAQIRRLRLWNSG